MLTDVIASLNAGELALRRFREIARIAGLANGTLVCCLPGSTNAVRTGWDGILAEQLDSRHRPCNFVAHLKQAPACETRG